MGEELGEELGSFVGTPEADVVGVADGDMLGPTEGDIVGDKVVGTVEGAAVGDGVRRLLGDTDGASASVAVSAGVQIVCVSVCRNSPPSNIATPSSIPL